MSAPVTNIPSAVRATIARDNLHASFRCEYRIGTRIPELAQTVEPLCKPSFHHRADAASVPWFYCTKTHIPKVKTEFFGLDPKVLAFDTMNNWISHGVILA